VNLIIHSDNLPIIAWAMTAKLEASRCMLCGLAVQQHFVLTAGLLQALHTIAGKSNVLADIASCIMILNCSNLSFLTTHFNSLSLLLLTTKQEYYILLNLPAHLQQQTNFPTQF
jgi:hypothetical protein